MRAALRRRRPKWLLVAVAKLDLYYNQIWEAQHYYSPAGEGPFTERIHQFAGQVGTDNFSWDAAPVCAWLEDFHWGKKVIASQLKPAQRDHFVARFAERLEDYCGR